MKYLNRDNVAIRERSGPLRILPCYLKVLREVKTKAV